MNSTRESLALGHVRVSACARDALARSGEDVSTVLARHRAGDWGDVDAEDWFENDVAVQYGSRVTSAYTTLYGHHLIVVTEADRSETRVLTHDED